MSNNDPDLDDFDRYMSELVKKIPQIAHDMMLEAKGPGYLSERFCIFSLGFVVIFCVN